MRTNLLQLEQRIKELDSLAEDVLKLVPERESGESQRDLSTKGQRWYRGGRELLVQQKSSSLAEFDSNYSSIIKDVIAGNSMGSGALLDKYFVTAMGASRALLMAVLEEIKSTRTPAEEQLSFAVSAEEFERALELLNAASGDEAIIRAAGVVGRVALERHLWTLIDVRGIVVQKNPATKKKADSQDLLTTLVKTDVITPIQKSELDSLFTIGNNCAHPKEVVVAADVNRLISRGRELAATIL